MTKTQYR